MRNAKSIVTSLATLVVLTGCGHVSPTGASSGSAGKTTRAPLQNTVQPTTQQPAQTGAPAAGGVDPQRILAAVRQAQQAQQGFSANILTYEKGPDGASTSQTMDVWWKRPSTLKIHITKGAGSSNDAKVLWTGGSSMQVRPSYLPFGSVSVDITDNRVMSANGWTIKETDISCILNVLLDPSSQVKVLAGGAPQAVEGKNVIMLQVTSPKSPKGVTMEQMGVDPSLNLPVVRMMYKGNTLAYKLVAKTFKLGVPSSDNLSM